MKKLSSDMQAHVSNEVTTLCKCWVLETRAGEKIGFTDHDCDISLEGVLCERDAGIESSDVEERIGLNVNTSEVSGALASDFITETDIDTGKYDGARVSSYVVNWNDSRQYMLDQVALVGEITRRDGHYKMELRSLSSTLEQTKGYHFIRRCQADLGDSRCKVSLNENALKTDGTVDEVLSGFIIRVKGVEQYESNWFRGGLLTWKTGLNINRSIEVTEHIKSDGSVVLHFWKPLPEPVQEFDTFEVRVGCDKEFATCKNKFANTVNFQGFPHMPGNKFVLNHAGNSGEFDGGPIIK